MVAYLFLSIKKLPFRGIGAIKIANPITNPVLLIESRLISAHVGHPAPFRIAHVENLAIVFNIRVETDRFIRTIERKTRIFRVYPSLLDPVAVYGEATNVKVRGYVRLQTLFLQFGNRIQVQHTCKDDDFSHYPSFKVPL